MYFVSNVCTGLDGKLFRSAKELCEFYDIAYGFYAYNKRLGYSVEEIIERYKKGKVKDHKGRFFKNNQEMCDYYKIDIVLFRKRIKAGWSLKDALTKPKQKEYIDTRPKKFKLKDGRTFKSHSEVSRTFGIANSTLAQRLNKGMSLDDAVSLPVRKVKK